MWNIIINLYIFPKEGLSPLGYVSNTHIIGLYPCAVRKPVSSWSKPPPPCRGHLLLVEATSSALKPPPPHWSHLLLVEPYHRTRSNQPPASLNPRSSLLLSPPSGGLALVTVGQLDWPLLACTRRRWAVFAILDSYCRGWVGFAMVGLDPRLFASAHCCRLTVVFDLSVIAFHLAMHLPSPPLPHVISSSSSSSCHLLLLLIVVLSLLLLLLAVLSPSPPPRRVVSSTTTTTTTTHRPHHASYRRWVSSSSCRHLSTSLPIPGSPAITPSSVSEQAAHIPLGRGGALVGILSGPGALTIGPTSLKRGEGHHAVWTRVYGPQSRRWGRCGGRMRENEATSTVITVDVEFKLRSRAQQSCSISMHSCAIRNIKW